MCISNIGYKVHSVCIVITSYSIHYTKLYELHVSVITIYKNRVVGALIRDMSTPALVREEIVSRAQRVNKQNMETVQKIAFLLGENASVMEELLHSIIESYSYGEEDKA